MTWTRTHSAETRAKISATLTGRKLDPAHAAKARVAGLGHTWTDAQRAAARAAVTPEQRAKMSAAGKGRPKSAETRARISAARMGHEVTAETRAKVASKMRIAMLGNTNMRDAPVKGECVYCFAPAQTRDHVIPRGRPGWDDPNNVVLACYWCNISKKNRTPEEWFAAMIA